MKTLYETLTESSEVESFVSQQASFKGSGWGAKASGGLNFISENSKVTNSITFMSSIQYVGNNIMLDPTNMKLTPHAK